MILTKIYKGTVAGLTATGPMTVVMLALIPFLSSDRRAVLPPKTVTERVTARPGLWQELGSGPRLITVMLAHFGYGAAAGGGYGLLSLGHRWPGVLSGMAYGLLIWAASYAGWLPVFDILPTPQQTSRPRNLQLILSHMVWGAVLGGLFRRLR